MNDEEIKQRVLKALADVLERDESELSYAATLRDDLGCDSLKLMTLFIVLEDEFKLNMPPEDVTDVNTVLDIVNFVRGKLAPPSPT